MGYTNNVPLKAFLYLMEDLHLLRLYKKYKRNSKQLFLLHYHHKIVIVRSFFALEMNEILDKQILILDVNRE